MSGKRVLKKKRNVAACLLTLSGLLLTALLLISLTGSAIAGESPLEQSPEAEPVPWALRAPSVAELDPETPQSHYWDYRVREQEPVPDSYFADAAFLGDSRTEGFALYSGLKKGHYFHAVGATVQSVFTKKVFPAPGGKEPLLDALGREDCGKIYIMLGVNELSWIKKDVFREQYARLIDRVRADHPEAQIAIEAILPVTAGQDAKGSYVNNGRIREYNQVLQRLALEKGCCYVDVAAAVTGPDGTLPREWSFDGVHLNPKGCRVWLQYLKTHPLS